MKDSNYGIFGVFTEIINRRLIFKITGIRQVIGLPQDDL